MFKTASTSAARVILVILTAGAAQSAPIPADSIQLQTVPAIASTAATGIETASYCTWVMTFEENTTEKPSWCKDDASSEG